MQSSTPTDWISTKQDVILTCIIDRTREAANGVDMPGWLWEFKSSAALYVSFARCDVVKAGWEATRCCTCSKLKTLSTRCVSPAAVDVVENTRRVSSESGDSRLPLSTCSSQGA